MEKERGAKLYIAYLLIIKPTTSLKGYGKFRGYLELLLLVTSTTRCDCNDLWIWLGTFKTS